jgi:hypothetical protein
LCKTERILPVGDYPLAVRGKYLAKGSFGGTRPVLGRETKQEEEPSSEELDEDAGRALQVRLRFQSQPHD